MFNYNRPPNQYAQDYVRYTMDLYTPFTHETRGTPTQTRERGGLAQSHDNTPTQQPTDTLMLSSGPYGYSFRGPEQGVVGRVLDGEDWLGRSFETWVLNPILNVCKRSFRKCFWTIATLLSLYGMISSACAFAAQIITAKLNSVFAIFVSVFMAMVPACLLLLSLFAFIHCKDVEPEILPWMWYQLTSLYKFTNQILRPPGHRIILWVCAGLPTSGLSEWLGNQLIRLGHTMAGEGKGTAPQVTAVAIVSTEMQTDPEETPTTITEEPTPSPAVASSSKRSTRKKTPTAHESSTTDNRPTNTTHTRATLGTATSRRPITTTRTTGTQTTTPSTAELSTPGQQGTPATTPSSRASIHTKTPTSCKSRTVNKAAKAACKPINQTTPNTGPSTRPATSAATQTTALTMTTISTQTEEPVAPQPVAPQPALAVTLYLGVQSEPAIEPSKPTGQFTFDFPPVGQAPVPTSRPLPEAWPVVATEVDSTPAPEPLLELGELIDWVSMVPVISDEELQQLWEGVNQALADDPTLTDEFVPDSTTITTAVVSGGPSTIGHYPQEVVEDDEAMSEAPSSEAPTNFIDINTLTAEVNVEMSDIKVEVEALVDDAMPDANAHVAQEDDVMSDVPHTTTTAPTPTGTVTIATITPITATPAPTTTASIPATCDQEMVDQSVADQPEVNTGNQGVHDDSKVMLAPPRLPRSYTGRPRGNLPARRNTRRPLLHGEPGYTVPLFSSAGPAATAAPIAPAQLSLLSAIHNSTTTPVNNTTGCMPTMSGGQNLTSASPRENLVVSDAELAAILLRAIAEIPTSQQGTTAPSPTTSTTTTSFLAPPANNATDDIMFPGWAQSQAAQIQAAQAAEARKRELTRLAQVEEKERAWLAERMNQQEDERADRELKRQAMAQLREDNERAEQGDNVIHGEPEDDHQESYELDKKYIAESPKSTHQIDYDRLLRDMTPEKFLAVWSLYPAPQAEYLDLAECVRLVSTEGPRTLVALAKKQYFLRSPKFESRIFWGKLLHLVRKPSQGNGNAQAALAQTPHTPAPASPHPIVPRYVPNQAPNFTQLTRPPMGLQPGPSYSPAQPQYCGNAPPNAGPGPQSCPHHP